jgi:hypothetical protein
MLAAILAAAALAFPPAAEWTAHCRVAEAELDLAFRSRSGTWDNDDMLVEARIGAAAPLRVPLAAALYEPFATLDNVENRCDRAVGVDAGAGKLLVLVAQNARPSFDELALVLLSTDPPAVLDVVDDAGTIKHPVAESIVVRAAGAHAYEVRIVREVLARACDCEGAYIEDWKRIEIADDRLRVGWARP